MLENVRCVVLNTSYEPLSVVSAKRGLRLIIEGKAIITEQHPDGFVRTTTKKFPLPVQIKLKNYVATTPAMRIPAQLTQRNLFVRDKYTCQYCRRKRSELGSDEMLTRDHIIPIARGGKDSWTNVVTSCRRCNNIKSDHFLSEMVDLWEHYEEQAENAALSADREFGRETADWIAEHLTEVRVNPRAPKIIEIWSKGGNLKLRKKKKKE